MSFELETPVWVSFGPYLWPCVVIDGSWCGQILDASQMLVMCFGTREMSIIDDPTAVRPFSDDDTETRVEEYAATTDDEALKDALKGAMQAAVNECIEFVSKAGTDGYSLRAEIENAFQASMTGAQEEGEENAAAEDGEDAAERAERKRRKREKKEKRNEEKRAHRHEKSDDDNDSDGKAKRHRTEAARRKAPPPTKKNSRSVLIENAYEAREEGTESTSLPTKEFISDAVLETLCAKVRSATVKYNTRGGAADDIGDEDFLLKALSELATYVVTVDQLVSTKIGVLLNAVWKTFSRFPRSQLFASAIVKYWFMMLPEEKRRFAVATVELRSTQEYQTQRGILRKARANATPPPPKPLHLDPVAKELLNWFLKCSTDVEKCTEISVQLSRLVHEGATASQVQDSAVAVLENLCTDAHVAYRLRLLSGEITPEQFVSTIFSIGLTSESQRVIPEEKVNVCTLYQCPNCQAERSVIQNEYVHHGAGEDDHFITQTKCLDCDHMWQAT